MYLEVQCFCALKKRFPTRFWFVVGLLTVIFAVACISPPGGHYDFNLRMSEIECIVSGVNPFLVWNETVNFPPYVSNMPKAPIADVCARPVNAYAPWEYMYMMPFALLPREMAWFFYCVLMGGAMLAMFFLVCSIKLREHQNVNCLLLLSFTFAIVSYLLWSNLSVGNFIALVLSASVLMAWALSKGRWLLAGVLWAFAMVKPQSAILFCVPLLVRGRMLTCVVAGATCLAASILPSYMCQSSILDMIAQGPAANAELFEGCGTWPKFLCGRFGNEADIGIGLAVGAVLCAWMTWLLRRERDWLVFLMPAAICASCWTYTQAYSHAMGWFVAYAIVSELLRNRRSKFLWTLFAISIPVLSRAFLAWHGCCAFFGFRFPMSEYAFRCVDSLNSTASLAIALAFCLWKWSCLRAPKLVEQSASGA